jgi:hypothetical protein
MYIAYPIYPQRYDILEVSVNKLVDSIEFDTLHRMSRGKPHVAKVGVMEINRYLAEEVGASLPDYFLPDVVTGGGRFSVRVAKYMRDMLDIKLTPQQKTTVGNIANMYEADGKTVLFDFTYEIMTWRRGSFGNERSCYRGSYNSSVRALETGTNHGPGFAIRLFKPGGYFYDGFRGAGRCWALPLANNAIVVFNGYGEKTHWFASLITDYLDSGLASRHVEVSISERTLYTNSGNGVIIGAPGRIKGKTIVRPRVISSHSARCHGCAETKWYTDDDGPAELGGNSYCRDCVRKCGISGGYGYITNMIRVLPGTEIDSEKVSEHDGEYWVRNEYESKLYLCERCGGASSRAGACYCDDDR